MTESVVAPGPQTRIDPRVEARLAKTGRVIRWAGTVASLLALAALFLPPLMDLLPQGPPFVRRLSPAAGTGLAILAIGIQLAGDTRRSVETGVFARRVGVGMSLLVAAFGSYLVVIFVLNRLDAWFMSDLDLPSFSVSLFMMVLGVAVPLTVSRFEQRVLVGQIASLLVFSLTGTIFVGYLLGDPSVGRVFTRPEISFHAVMISLLLALGVLLIRPGSGLLSTASSPGAGGRLLRRVGPLVLLTPAVLVGVAEAMPPSERIDVLAMISVGLGLFLLVLLGVIVHALDETAIEAATAAAQAERARVGLSQEAPLVSQIAELLHIADIEEIDGWDVVTRFRPARGSVAGDTSAVRLLPDDAIGVVLVDVTGHGVEPAIRAVTTRDLLFNSLACGHSPARAMELAVWSTLTDQLASAIVVKVDKQSGQVAVASAGHPPAILLRTQDAQLVGPTGPLLFLDRASGYGEEMHTLSPGDSLVFYSDGVADVQRQSDGRPEPEALADLLLAEGGVPSRTAELVLGFAESHPRDDQSVVVLSRSL